MLKFFLAGFVVFAVTGACAIASAQDQAAIEAGEAIYDEHCAMCHGEKLRDPGSFPDLRQLRVDQRPHFDRIVTDGRGQMPAWGGTLGEKELDQVWAYIRAHARQ
jgi:quinohemoprotein ethanol dehydrogenase